MARHKAKEQPAQPAASHPSRRSSQPPGQNAALRGNAGAPLVPPSLGVSAEAAAFLTASGAKLLQMAPVTLVFPPGTWQPPRHAPCCSTGLLLCTLRLAYVVVRLYTPWGANRCTECGQPVSPHTPSRPSSRRQCWSCSAGALSRCLLLNQDACAMIVSSQRLPGAQSAVLPFLSACAAAALFICSHLKYYPGWLQWYRRNSLCRVQAVD